MSVEEFCDSLYVDETIVDFCWCCTAELEADHYQHAIEMGWRKRNFWTCPECVQAEDA